jgi:glycerophosphoryl diester phosphodiesterase
MRDDVRSLARRLVKQPWLQALDPLVTRASLEALRLRRTSSEQGTPPSTLVLDRFYEREHGVRPLLLGHRGAMARAPENTLGAFRAALDDGGDGFELDTQLTGDGVPIVLHDDTLDRTTNLTGLPVRHAADELDDVDAGSWFTGWGAEKVPRLHEALACLPDGGVCNVELKGPTPESLGLERRVLDVIRAHTPRVHVIISSFHPAQLLEVRRLDPAMPIGLLVDNTAVLPLRTAWAAPLLMPDAVHPPSPMVDDAFVVAAHKAGLRVHVWAVAGAADAQRLLSLGVDGLIVDDVLDTRAVLDAHLRHD